MTFYRNSLAARIFLAIAATSILVVGFMALQVGLSMRNGFAQYLLRGELTRFDTLVEALAEDHDAESPGWPDLAGDPRTWGDFIHVHGAPENVPDGGPGRMVRRGTGRAAAGTDGATAGRAGPAVPGRTAGVAGA